MLGACRLQNKCGILCLLPPRSTFFAKEYEESLKIKVRHLIQTFTSLRNSLLRTGRCGAIRILHRTELSVHMANFTCACKGVRMKSKLQGSPVKIKTPTHWNLIGRSTTAPPSALSPRSILLPPSSLGAFIPARKTPMLVPKMSFLGFFLSKIT